jgi:hypothetical protein
VSLFGVVDSEREEHDYCEACKQFHLRGEDHDCYDTPELTEQAGKTHAD